MKKLIPLLLVSLLIVGGCTTSKKEKPAKDPEVGYCGDDEESKSCALGSADMSAYKGFTDNQNVFTQTTMDAAIAMFKEKKSGILYFGYPACPWCVEAVPVMDEVAKDAKKIIHYIPTRDADKKLLYTDKQKQEIIPYLKKYLTKKDGAYQLYVPLVVVVKDGKAISGNTGTVEGHDAKERKMNDKEKNELKKIYQDMFS